MSVDSHVSQPSEQSAGCLLVKIFCRRLDNDFYSEIAHFNSLIENHQLESNIMSLDSSVNCAKILSAIKERF